MGVLASLCSGNRRTIFAAAAFWSPSLVFLMIAAFAAAAALSPSLVCELEN